ncbi:Uncharacterised protein [Segatella copri]|nr:Uncharacterised protein [Segatella copri]
MIESFPVCTESAETPDVGNFPFCAVAQVAVASIAHITVSFFIFFLVFVFICKGTAFRA